MTIDFSEKGKVKFIINDYVENLLDKVPKEMLGHAATLAANQLFSVNDKAGKISDEDSKKYHHLMAKLLYLSKRARAKIFKPLWHFCASELSTLEADGSGAIQLWIDASFAVHLDMKSHTTSICHSEKDLYSLVPSVKS